jgi:PAS domain S-box-containing protein
MRTLSKEELISKLEAINRSNAIIDFDLDGNILKVNDIFLQAVGYKKGDSSKLIGRHHSIFVTPDYAESEEYKQFWENLRSGKFFSGEFKRVKRDGSALYLQATYNPIIDDSGQVYKIMKIAIDITKTVNHQKEIETLKANLEEELEKSEKLKNSIEIEKNAAINDLDILIKRSQSELIGTVVKVALLVIVGVGVITTGLYAVAIYTSKDTQIIAFSIVGTIMGVKYATEKK